MMENQKKIRIPKLLRGAAIAAVMTMALAVTAAAANAATDGMLLNGIMFHILSMDENRMELMDDEGNRFFVTAVDGDLVREEDGRGRHTTTHRQLLRLPGGVLIIDTPGMRELGLWEAGEGLGEAFPDVEALLGQCRFSDCRHQSEPGCAVRAALEAGELSPQRWESWQKLQAENAASDWAALLRQKGARNKAISKAVRAQEKLRRKGLRHIE